MVKKTILGLFVFIAIFVMGGGVVGAQGLRAKKNSDDGVETRTIVRENVCSRIGEAWEAKLKGYERAREVRKKAFERTTERWEKLFDKLDEKKIDTAGVRADAVEVKTKFEALIAADDALFEAMKKAAEAVCANEGVDAAKQAVNAARKARREAREAFRLALKKLHTDLAKLRQGLGENSN